MTMLKSLSSLDILITHDVNIHVKKEFSGTQQNSFCLCRIGLKLVPGGYSHTLTIQVCAAQRGRDFEAPDLERGIHFRGVF